MFPIYIMERFRIFISALVQKPFCIAECSSNQTQPLALNPACGLPQPLLRAALAGWASHDHPDHSSSMQPYSTQGLLLLFAALHSSTATAGSAQLLWYSQAKQKWRIFSSLNLEQDFFTNSSTNPAVLLNKQALPHFCIYEVWLGG